MEKLSENLPSYYAIFLQEKCSDAAANFLIDKLSTEMDDNANELQISQQPPAKACPMTVLHISAGDELVYKIAQYLEIKKEDNNGYIRAVTVDTMKEFPESGRVGPLSLPEVQRCILYAMERLHFNDENSIPGHDDLKVTNGAPIINTYLQYGLISYCAVHDNEEKEKLLSKWTYSIMKNPISEIRNYFGENIAFYFSFLELYTTFLCIIAGFGVIEFLLMSLTQFSGIYSNLTLTTCHMIGLALFLEVWKRRMNTQAFQWGTMGRLRNKPPRPEFRGTLQKNEITGKVELMYPKEETYKRMAFVSYPITLGCLLVVFVMMLIYFKIKLTLAAFLTNERFNIFFEIIKLIPTICYSYTVQKFNQKYTTLAKDLTDAENHRSQENYEFNLLAKLILFKFVNTFLALFYVAFYLQDLAMLRSYITCFLITHQIIGQLEESVLPMIKKEPVAKTVKETIDKVTELEKVPVMTERNLKLKFASDSDITTVTNEYEKDPYDSTFSDYTELWIQFGYASMFISIYPLGSVFALINNLVEIPVDRNKLCKYSRKPNPIATRSTKAWFVAFWALAMISVSTNCALIGIDMRKTAGSDWTTGQWFMLFIAVEHILFSIMAAIDKIIPDVPRDVKRKMDKTENYLKILSQTTKDGRQIVHFGTQNQPVKARYLIQMSMEEPRERKETDL